MVRQTVANAGTADTVGGKLGSLPLDAECVSGAKMSNSVGECPCMRVSDKYVT